MSIKNFTVEILVLLFAAFTVSGTELILADQGKTDYVIVAASAGTKLNRLAVKEFSAFFEESTGARPEVIPGKNIRNGFSSGTFLWCGNCLARKR